MEFRCGSAIDVGRRRDKQDDSLLVADWIFAVADGMGGHVGGDVASSTAIDALRSTYTEPGDADSLEAAVNRANQAVTQRAEQEPSLRSMGTTLAAVAVIDQGGDEAFGIANVGDSRVYLLRDGELTQLTDDHSVPQELLRAGQLTEAQAAVDPRRNQLTRVLGIGEAEPDVQTLVPYQGDRVLICSDGLYNEVTDGDIASVLRTVDDPDAAASRLVDMANENGGGDNIAVVVVDVVDDGGRAAAASTTITPTATARPSTLMSAEERNAELRDLGKDADAGADGWDDEPAEQELPTRRVTFRVIAFILVLLLVVGAGFGAITWYARGTYAVKLEDGRVVIFKGRPDKLLWFEPTVERRTSITDSALTGGEIELLREGRTEPTRQAAEAYVASLRERIEEREAAAATTTTVAPTATTTPPSPPTTAAG